MIYVFLSSLLVLFFLFTLYNVPIVLAGARNLLQSRNRRKAVSKGSGGFVDFDGGRLPFVSVLVPVKNEEKVVGRLLDALLRVDYPASRMEVIVVDDASTDRTGEICFEYASKHSNVKVLKKEESSTKATALNFGLKSAVGDVVATFDGDSVPEIESFRRAVEYFSDSRVAGVQGRICSINAGQNMLTKFLSYEGAVQFELYWRGKDALDLYVGLGGTCQFIRRSVLLEVGGWNEDCLAEDTELSLRMLEKDYVVRYASEVRTWEESPCSVKGLVAQRARWFRGYLDVGPKFGRLMKKPTLKRLDAEVTLFGVFVLMLCVVNFVVPLWGLTAPPGLWTVVIGQFTSIFTLAVLTAVGVALVGLSQPFRLRNLLWLPFIFAYWSFQSFIALYALLQTVFRRPKRWHKTEHSGLTTRAPEE